MKVSIIVPIYNAEKYLEQTLSSLINQSLRDIEIICVNDGSTDGTLELLEDFAKRDERIVVVTTPNSGQSAARNLGLKLAKGEYVGFLDADDWAEPDAFEKLYNISNGNDIGICSIKVCTQTFQKIDDSYLSLRVFPESLDNRVFTHKDCSDFLFRISVTPWNKLYRKEFLDKSQIRFVVGVNFEDNIFFLETFLHAESIRILREPLICYRVDSSTSYSRGKDDSKKLDFFKVIKFQERLISEFTEYRHQFLLHKKTTLNYWYKKVKNPKVKFLYALKMIMLYPMFALSGLLYPIKTRLKLCFLPKNSYFWGEDGQCQLLEQFSLMDRRVSLKNIAQIPSDAKIIALTQSYYNYSSYVEEALRRNGFRNEVIECILPLW